MRPLFFINLHIFTQKKHGTDADLHLMRCSFNRYDLTRLDATLHCKR